MGKERDDKKRLETATALLALAAQSPEADEMQTECSAPEEFAAYSEGRGKDLELSTFFAHLEGCDSCYRQWLTVNEERVRQDHSSAASRLKKYSYIGSALALAASVVVFLNLREPVPVLMQFDENEVARPSLPEIQPQQLKTAAEPVLGPDIEATQISPPQAKLTSKAKRVYKPLQERASDQVALTTAKKDTLGGFNGWIDKLRKGCLTGQWESSFWKSLAEQGEIIYKKEISILSTSELSLLRKLLMQINQMDENTISGQCEQVLQILAEEDQSR